MITKVILERKMSFFDKTNNYLIVNSIKEILKGRDPEESLPDSVQVGTFQKYVINSEWKIAGLTCWCVKREQLL